MMNTQVTSTTSTHIHQVSDTAFLAAAYRARETERKEPLFRDPFAALLAGERGRRIVDALPAKAFIGGWTVVIRTRVIDELIRDAVAGGVETVLNLGAGLDARPYRMDLPASLRWIEVDQAHVIDYKETVLANETPRCRLERVRLDLADDIARRAFLASVAQSSSNILVLTEAVTPYLTEDSVAALATDLHARPSFRSWINDYFSPASYDYRRRSGMTSALKNAPFLFEPNDYFGFFAQSGWVPQQERYLAEEAEKFKRPAPFPAPMRLLMMIGGLFASPEQKKGMKRYTGYIQFVPTHNPGL